MKYKIKKMLIVILFVISLIINIVSIRSTYAKYQEEVNTDYQVFIRKWLINVNDKDIQDETMLMSTVLQPTLIENEHIKSNIIAPGREGYFEIDLDYTKVDVPFTYSFEIEQKNTNKLLDFEFFGYSILENCSEFEIDNIENTITYIGAEGGTGTETTDSTTGDKTLEVVQSVEDAETGVERNRIIKATLTTSEEEPTATEAVVGRIATVTEKTVDATTEEIIEAEKILFKMEQKLLTDESTGNKKTVFYVTQPVEPTELETYQRYQNLRVYFRWNDSTENQMNNMADTQFRGETNPDANVANTLLKYQGTMKFKQYTQE